MVDVEQGLYIFGVLISIDLAEDLIVLVAKSRWVKVCSLRAEFVPHCELLVDNLLKCWVSSQLWKVTNDIQDALQGDVVPVNIFQKLSKISFKFCPCFLALTPHAYSLQNFIFLCNMEKLML